MPETNSRPTCEILVGDCLSRLRDIPDGIVQTVVTSPPYWGLRDYGVAGQLGLERTPEEYVARMVEVFREVRRVLRDDGTLWLNIGDSYTSGGRTWRAPDKKNPIRAMDIRPPTPECLKPKDLVGIPWMVAFALRAQDYLGNIRNESDRAWLAGLIDGEGCITILQTSSPHGSGDSYPPILQVRMCDPECIEHAVRVTGRGSMSPIQESPSLDGQRGVYHWRLSARAAADTIAEIYPHLLIKRRQAIVAWNHQAVRDGYTVKKGAKIPRKAVEKQRFCRDLIRKLNAREPVDIPSWMVEPTVPVGPGWYLRSDCIWAKPNPMPESVTDRPTKAHEYLFLLAKSARYFYDADAVKEAANTVHKKPRSETESREHGLDPVKFATRPVTRFGDSDKRNRRTVWTVTPKPFKGAHFATMPPDLVEPCILAGSRPGDVVLDPFSGAGTTGLVALEHGRSFLGIELNPEYAEMARERLASATPDVDSVLTAEDSEVLDEDGTQPSVSAVSDSAPPRPRYLPSVAGSDTSAAAAASLAASADQLRARVFAEIRDERTAGLTCDEVESRLSLKHQTASARIRELVLEGRAVDSGERRVTRSGRKAAVWVAREYGVQPPLKYAGGKRWLVPRLRELYAPHRHRRLVEPFVGGMAVALGLRPERALLADASPHVINFYARIRKPGPFTIDMRNDEALYYAHRERFNALISQPGGHLTDEAAEIFYYLNRTCFNGLARFNRDGKFNVPFGKYKKVHYARDFSVFSEILRPWTLVCGDFGVLNIERDDFVYIDPPYDEQFSDYVAVGFGWDDHVRLARRFAAHQGPVAASNSSTPRVLELYCDLGFDVFTLPAPRSIAASGDREPVHEMLAVRNFPIKPIDSLCADPALTVHRVSSKQTRVAKEREEANPLIGERYRPMTRSSSESENENEKAPSRASERSGGGLERTDRLSEEQSNQFAEEGDFDMAHLPKGFGLDVANADATVPRQQRREGDYIMVHKAAFLKQTTKGDAIIIEHDIIDAKKTDPDIDPSPVGTQWGHFLPMYGEAAVMCKPNLKAYVLGLLGLDEKKVDKEVLGQTIDAMLDERQAARGMLIRGVTFHAKKRSDGGDFMGVNWYAVPGENVMNSPSVLARRTEIEKQMGSGIPGDLSAPQSAAPGFAAPAPGFAAPVQAPGGTFVQSLPGIPPFPAAPPPPAPPADPLAALLAQGWIEYPGRPDLMYRGRDVKEKAKLLAGG